jgi:hypothetical protein
MPITWRRASCNDIGPCLAIQPKHFGCNPAGPEAVFNVWKHLASSPFFASAVMEAHPPIGGHCLVGFGAAVFVLPGFVDAEIANPRPDINSRIFANILSGRPVLAIREDVALANGDRGVDVAVLFGSWRDEILSPAERDDIQTVYASSFAECLAGYRIRRIIHESVDGPGKQFAEKSVVYQTIAEFPEPGRTIYLMTRESARAMPASIGNIIFKFNEPMLRLRKSDQQLLLSALRGATDLELVAELGLTLAAIKARWRSILTLVSEKVPALTKAEEESERRGKQRRHRVLAYVRAHPEELRPYDWKQRPGREARWMSANRRR